VWFALADQPEAHYTKANTYAATLTRSRLANTIRGEARA